jgi:hypothetical protein
MDASPATRRRAPLVLACLLAPLLALCWWPTLDRYASDSVDAALGRALAAYAVARGINAAISVAQSASVAVQPAGVGVEFSPGEVLDPVNDLIEQFSTLMLMAAGSLGLQKLMVGVSAWLPLKVMLSVAVLAWWVLAWRRAGRAAAIARTVAVGLIALRLAVPLSALASEAAYQALLADDFERAQTALADTRELLATQGESLRPPVPDDASVIERARAWIDDATDALDLDRRLAQLEATASAATRHVVDLIAVFVVQTLLLPLAFLYLVMRLFRALAWRLPEAGRAA